MLNIVKNFFYTASTLMLLAGTMYVQKTHAVLDLSEDCGKIYDAIRQFAFLHPKSTNWVLVELCQTAK